jgi:hypothetical protein
MPRSHLIASLAVKLWPSLRLQGPIRGYQKLRGLAASGVTNTCDYNHIFGNGRVGHINMRSITRPERRSNQSVGAPLLALFEKGPPDSRHHWTPR